MIFYGNNSIFLNMICRLEVLDEAEEENVGENEDQQTVKAHCMSFSEF